MAQSCERDDAYRRICGGVGVDHHTLANFRTGRAQWLDQQLTRWIASLLDRRLIERNVVAKDSLRLWASAKAAGFSRRDKLLHLHRLAQAQVAALKRELAQDAGACTRRRQAALVRAAREHEEWLAQAIATMDKLSGRLEPKQPKPSTRCGKGRGSDDPPTTGAAAGAASPAPRTTPRTRPSARRW